MKVTDLKRSRSADHCIRNERLQQNSIANLPNPHLVETESTRKTNRLAGLHHPRRLAVAFGGTLAVLARASAAKRRPLSLSHGNPIFSNRRIRFALSQPR